MKAAKLRRKGELHSPPSPPRLRRSGSRQGPASNAAYALKKKRKRSQHNKGGEEGEKEACLSNRREKM